MVKILIKISFLLFAVKLSAQDIHFSQYQNIPTSINPALTGLTPIENTNRIMSNYRTQWLNPIGNPAYRTFSLGFDTYYCPISCLPGEVKLFGFGFNFFHDRAGAGPLNRTQANVQFSFSFTVGAGLLLGVGAEGGAILHDIGNGELKYDEQFVNGAYDPSVQAEAFDKNYTVMPDFGAGLTLYTTDDFSLDRLGFNIGGAAKHLSTPEYGFYDNAPEGKPTLPMRFNIHARAHILLNDGKASAIDVRGLFMHQGAYRQLLAGLDGILYLKNRSIFPDLTGGLAWRSARYLDSGWQSNALVFSALIQTHGCQVGLSYDVGLSKIKSEQDKAAWELSLQFFLPGRKKDCHIRGPLGL